MRDECEAARTAGEGCSTESTYLDVHVIIEEDVAQFQVSVDDLVVVQVLDTLQQLGHVVASFRLRHSLTTLVQLQ